MKITDFALIFIGVTLPIIIIVYINVSFTIKAEQQEMYYTKIINLAIEDATKEMKQVENEDAEIDYGYSGERDKKISVNSQIAVDTFFNSLYNNFGIAGNDSAEKYLQMFVPVVAIVDYNGVQVSSVESYSQDGQARMGHILKPKRYYTISYHIVKNSANQYELRWQGDTKTGGTVVATHTLEITMDDYITHRGAYFTGKGGAMEVKNFYLADSNNNSDLGRFNAGGQSSTSVEAKAQRDLTAKVVNYIKENKQQIMANTLMEEMSYSVNAHNQYARSAGVTYSFNFPAITSEELSEYVDNVGIIAIVQGISMGNKYLNTKSYGVSKLELTNRYYFSIPTANSKYHQNLYHKDEHCLEYLASSTNGITPTYVITKQQAASAKISKSGVIYQGFYPCPICRP